jgi:hypothetical protein
MNLGSQGLLKIMSDKDSNRKAHEAREEKPLSLASFAFSPALPGTCDRGKCACGASVAVCFSSSINPHFDFEKALSGIAAADLL